jgi:hypothetical protein
MLDQDGIPELGQLVHEWHAVVLRRADTVRVSVRAPRHP